MGQDDDICVEANKVIYMRRKCHYKESSGKIWIETIKGTTTQSVITEATSRMSWMVYNSHSLFLLKMDSVDDNKGFELEIKDSSTQLSGLHLSAWSLQDFCFVLFKIDYMIWPHRLRK